MTTQLSWSLMICTYNRADFLMESLKHIMNQSRLPSEVVIVDASDYWNDTYQKVLQTYQGYWDTIRLVYECAKIRGIPHQKNQALELCESEIVFSIDDDIYLHPNAARKIMEVYEKDTNSEIAMIGGHFVEEHPDQHDFVEKEPRSAQRGIVDFVKSRLERSLTMDRQFVPYGKPINHDNPPTVLQGMGLFPSGLINGGRTTFRRCFGIQVRWTSLLSFYSTHEDSDFSYRMGNFGRLLVAPDAKFFHADGAEDRPDRFKTSSIAVLNLMALHRVSSDNKGRSAFRLFATFSYFIVLYLLIDPAQKRFSFPVVRSYTYGLFLIPVFMFYPFQDFTKWYKIKQEKIHFQR